MTSDPLRDILTRNSLLSSIPHSELDRLAPHLTPVVLMRGDVICELGKDEGYVYFPTDAVVSLEDGASRQIAVVGNEGVVGIALCVGIEVMPNRAVVRSPGRAFRMKAEIIRDELFRAGPAQNHFLRYARDLLVNLLGLTKPLRPSH